MNKSNKSKQPAKKPARKFTQTKLRKLTPAKFCDATNACEEGRAFAIKCCTMAKAWEKCERSDWLLWVMRKIEAQPDEKALRLFMVWCARNTPLPNGRTTSSLLTDLRSLEALAAAERFAHGDATAKELSAAEAAAWNASYGAGRVGSRDPFLAAAWSAARERRILALLLMAEICKDL